MRYSLSHLVKDEHTLKPDDWTRTVLMVQHGALAAGNLTGVFDLVSASSAASTGIMDLRTNQWRKEMLDALAKPEYRDWQNTCPHRMNRTPARESLCRHQSASPAAPRCDQAAGRSAAGL